MKRVIPLLSLGALALLVGACGSGGGGPAVPTIQKARTFELAGFEPTGPIEPGKPVKVSFFIRQPSGKPLTTYKRGAGPHTGLHLIFVRNDLATIIHKHPPIGPDGRATENITFPSPGKYRLIVDAYPNLSGPLRNFQLFRNLQVGTTDPKKPLPPFKASQTVDGYHVQLMGKPKLRAIEAALMKVKVTDPNGKPAKFVPYFGALAHAIFFRSGNLDYFHTHVCAPGAAGCTSLLGGASVTGRSSTPGNLTVGVLLPEPGRWRLFIQFESGRTLVTAPFTLNVA